MTYDVTLAVLADWLPSFDPPVGGNGFTVPYDERLKVELRVEPTDTLASVYRRALAELKPVVASDSLSRPDDLMDAIYWVWFYEPGDSAGTGEKVYERPEDLILIDESGRARWNLPSDELPYGDLVRSGEHGLLRGDPFRPYLPLLQPQGGGDLQFTWEAIQEIWRVLDVLLTARGAVALGAEARDRIAGRLNGRRVVAEHSEEWQERGGDPARVRETLERRPWAPDDLRMIMNLRDEHEAKEILALFGFEPTPSGLYELTDDGEARLLRLAEDDVFVTVAAADPDLLQARLETLFETGELPPVGFD